MKIPPSHPRYESLRIRELLELSVKSGVVVPQGLIAHGRGEAFDYLLGEKTSPWARRAVRAAAAYLLKAENPVISVNGNSAALVPSEIAKLGITVPANVEVNLFHKSAGRAMKIAVLLRKHGVSEVFGLRRSRSVRLKGISSRRAAVDAEGIGSADVVVVPLEDGDRTLALRKAGKRVLAIDLNPLSRTSRTASVTIIDNIVRAMPLLVSEVQYLKKHRRANLNKIIANFDNQQNLKHAALEAARYLREWDGR